MGDNRQTIVDICRRLYDRGYLVATSGNVSIRMGDSLLITPRAVRKDAVTPDQIVECLLVGAHPAGPIAPSSELEMHRAAYTARPDIGAVIHAHCPHCVTCSVIGISLDKPLLPEGIVYTGPAPTVDYAIPGSPEQAATVSPYLKDHNAMLLARHGVLVLGAHLEDAFSRLEQLEYTARIAYLAKVAGGAGALPRTEIARLAARLRENGTLLLASISRLIDKE